VGEKNNMSSVSATRCRTLAASVLGLILLTAAWLPGAARAQSFNLQLTTSRGCRETGDDPVFAVGETIRVSFRVGSDMVSAASVTLFDVLPDGRIGVASFGMIATNQTRSFAALIGPPTGIEQLVLRADASGVNRTQRSCSFR